MSGAAARGAAGYLYASGRLGKQKAFVDREREWRSAERQKRQQDFGGVQRDAEIKQLLDAVQKAREERGLVPVRVKRRRVYEEPR